MVCGGGEVVSKVEVIGMQSNSSKEQTLTPSGLDGLESLGQQEFRRTFTLPYFPDSRNTLVLASSNPFIAVANVRWAETAFRTLEVLRAMSPN